MRNGELFRDFRRALPDFSAEDNVGSPYCVRRYIADKHLGGPDGLATARKISQSATFVLSSTLCRTMSLQTTPGSSSTLNISSGEMTKTLRETRHPSLKPARTFSPADVILTSRLGLMCSNSTASNRGFVRP